MTTKPSCDGCIVQEATVEIVLAEGQIFYACETCIFLVIQEQADTDNPVHTMDELTDD